MPKKNLSNNKKKANAKRPAVAAKKAAQKEANAKARQKTASTAKSKKRGEAAGLPAESAKSTRLFSSVGKSGASAKGFSEGGKHRASFKDGKDGSPSRGGKSDARQRRADLTRESSKRDFSHKDARSSSARGNGIFNSSRGDAKPVFSSRGSGGRKSTSKGAVLLAPDPKSESVCKVSHLCGACTAIDEEYSQQLADKQLRILTLFADLKDEGCDIRPIKGAANPFHYRNKIISPFAPGGKLPAKKSGKNAGEPRYKILTGMYAAGTHQLVDTSRCLVENPQGQRIVQVIKHLMGKFGIAPYNEDTGEGFMRHAVVRIGHNSGEVLVTLVTNGADFPTGKRFARALVGQVPAITTVVQNINIRDTNAVLGLEERTLYGPGFILDTLCGLSFRISSTSFYQVTAGQTEVLYQSAVDMAKEALGRDVLAEAAATGGLAEKALADESHDGEVHEGKASAGVWFEGEARVEKAATEGCAAESSRSRSVTELRQPLSVLDAYCGTGTIGLVAASQLGNAQVIGVDTTVKAIADARLNAQHNGVANARFEAGDAGAFMRKLAATGQKLDLLFMDPPRSGSDALFLQSAVQAAPRAIVYISCNPETQHRDVAVLVENGYRIAAIQPVDMFPHTDHIENICLLVLDQQKEGTRA